MALTLLVLLVVRKVKVQVQVQVVSLDLGDVVRYWFEHPPLLLPGDLRMQRQNPVAITSCGGKGPEAAVD